MQKTRENPPNVDQMKKSTTLYARILTCRQLAGNLLKNGAQKSNLGNTSGCLHALVRSSSQKYRLAHRSRQ